MRQDGYLIQKIAVLYLVMWTISPPLGIDMIYRYLALGCVGLWALVVIKRGYYIEKIHMYAILFAVAVAFIAYWERGSIDGILQQIAMYILVISFLMNAFYKAGHWQELEGIVPIVLIVLAVFNYTTAEMLIEDPGIARRIVRADAATFDYMRQGVGGYGLIYPQVCISSAIFAWIKSAFRKNKVCFAIGCIWLYTFIIYLISAGYSIAIFATAVGIVMLICYRGRNVTGAILVAVGVFAGFMCALIYWDGFREFLLTFFEGTEVVTKINDLVSTSETGVAEDSIYARMKVYSATFNTILEYPFTGALWMAGGGGHSAVLDAVAKYGILGGYMYITMIFHVPNDYKKNYKNSAIYRISNAVIVSMLFVSVLNSFPFNFMCMILLVLPLLYEDIIKWEEIRR